MNIKFWMRGLTGLFLVTGSVQAMADNDWNYDESTQTIIFSVSDSPVTQSSSQIEDEVVEHAGAWYYDEDSDTIVINSAGSRSIYARTNPSINTPLVGLDMAYLDL